MVAVRWYVRYGLSYRDLEELLAERGITVYHVTIYRLPSSQTGRIQRSRLSATQPSRSRCASGKPATTRS